MIMPEPKSVLKLKEAKRLVSLLGRRLPLTEDVVTVRKNIVYLFKDCAVNGSRSDAKRAIDALGHLNAKSELIDIRDSISVTVPPSIAERAKKVLGKMRQFSSAEKIIEEIEEIISTINDRMSE